MGGSPMPMRPEPVNSPARTNLIARRLDKTNWGGVQRGDTFDNFPSRRGMACR